MIRNAIIEGRSCIGNTGQKVYESSSIPVYTEAALRSQINNFPEGQLAVVYDQKVVGYCASFRVSGKIPLKPHTWIEITGNGFAPRHNPEGEYLYGMKICVDPSYRGYRIGQRLYIARKQPARNLR